MTIEQLLREATDKLKDNGYVHGEREAMLMLQPLFDQDTAWFITHGENEVADETIEQFTEYVEQRINGKPLAYILGTQQFMGWQLACDERALIPRPETEQLVEQVVKQVRDFKLESGKFLEIGTGTGAISLALKKYFPEADVTATDVSTEALELAEENRARLKVDIDFIESDLFNSVPKEQYDLIVANLPYVPTQKLEFVSEQILDWEPMIAIEAGEDGLGYIRPFLNDLPKYLSSHGIAAIEMWHTHADAVIALAKNLPHHEVVIEKDLAGFDRFALFLPI